MISLSDFSSEVYLGETIHFSGTIDPPLKIFELTLRYNGPNMRFYETTLSTGTDGGFIDVFTPPLEGIWNISLSFVESEYYNYELNHQVLVNTTETVDSSYQDIISVETETEEKEYFENGEVETSNNEDNDDETVVIVDPANQTEIENPDTEIENSKIENDSSIEPDTDNKVGNSEIQLVSQTEEETNNDLPITFGFIPSILTIIMMLAVYLGTQRLR